MDIIFDSNLPRIGNENAMMQATEMIKNFSRFISCFFCCTLSIQVLLLCFFFCIILQTSVQLATLDSMNCFFWMFLIAKKISFTFLSLQKKTKTLKICLLSFWFKWNSFCKMKISRKNVCFGGGAHDRCNRFKASTPTDGAAFKTDYAYTQRKQNKKTCNGYDNV